MVKICQTCDEALNKGLLRIDPMIGLPTVSFTYNKKFNDSKKQVVFAYVCKKCGYTELITNIATK